MNDRQLIENIVAYVNITGDTSLDAEEAVIQLLASHQRLRDQNAAQHCWFRAAWYWRRLLLTWSGFPW